MEEDSAQNQPVEIPAQPPKPWLKIVLFVAVGVILVGGLVFAGYRIGSKMNCLPPSPISTIAPAGGPGLTWKTYQDGKISFRYPAEWKVLETWIAMEPLPGAVKTLNFLIQKENQKDIFVPSIFAVKVYLNEEPNFNLEDYLFSYDEDFKRLKEKKNSDTETFSEILLGGRKAFRYDNIAGMNYGVTEVYWTSKNFAIKLGSISQIYVYEELYKLLGDPPYKSDNVVFNGILSTFKFLD
ncbi:hypothetical protein FJZ40_04390 [Candidatus Shapirobacteria bacterium]|nr:hypothetical protein [Candidatus Shapirobacteria bacterium]